MGAAAPALSYLFAAQFLDGTRVEQTQDDVSISDPCRSAYYDLCQCDADGKVLLDSYGISIPRSDIAFFGLTNGAHYYVVDLRDGHFEVDGARFDAQPTTRPEISDGGRYRLVYFRDRRQHIAHGIDGSSTAWESPIRYRFGWEYVDPDGRKWQQTLVIE